ncbi:hypothetical protein FF2_015207 [Malus domestica]
MDYDKGSGVPLREKGALICVVRQLDGGDCGSAYLLWARFGWITRSNWTRPTISTSLLPPIIHNRFHVSFFKLSLLPPALPFCYLL